MKLNCTHQLSDYADDVNIMGRSIYTIKENTIFGSCSKETRLEVNDHKIQYMVISQDQNDG